MINSKEERAYEKIIHGYLFHYNCYKHLWHAFPRGEHKLYINGECKNIISHSDIDECINAVIIKEEKNV